MLVDKHLGALFFVELSIFRARTLFYLLTREQRYYERNGQRFSSIWFLCVAGKVGSFDRVNRIERDERKRRGRTERVKKEYDGKENEEIYITRSHRSVLS